MIQHAAENDAPFRLSRDARWKIGEAMLDGRYDHSWNCSAHDEGGECDCWAQALRDLLDLAAACSCGSAGLYAENPPRLGPHHYASCSRWREPRVLPPAESAGPKCQKCGQPVVYSSEHPKMGPVWKCPIPPARGDA